MAKRKGTKEIHEEKKGKRKGQGANIGDQNQQNSTDT
jgi:hypothetical protein